MTVTLCLPGYTQKPRLDDQHLGGDLFKGRYTRRDIIYANSWFGQANFDDGRAKVKAAALRSSGNVILLGQSMGARIVCSLLDDPDMLEGCPPSRCVAVLTGNPDRHFNGAATIPNTGFFPAYGVNGIPDDVQYRTFDVANQYGIAEDSPNNRKVTQAVKNVSAAVHSNYQRTRINDPRNSVWKDPANPNVTYVLAPTYPLPSIEAKTWLSLKQKDREDAQLRPIVESAYTRPMPAPTSKINRIFSTDWAWDGEQGRLVKLPTVPAWDPFR